MHSNERANNNNNTLNSSTNLHYHQQHNLTSPSPLTPSRGSDNKAKVVEIYNEIANLLGANVDKDVIELAMKLLSSSTAAKTNTTTTTTDGGISVNSEALAALIVELQNETKKLAE